MLSQFQKRQNEFEIPQEINQKQAVGLKSPAIESCEAISDECENAQNLTERRDRKRVIKSIDLTQKPHVIAGQQFFSKDPIN